jgi:apolipoprotein N-acyltransferase
VANGADFLFNPTSEGDLGRHIYYNTWASCVLRAIENRVGVVRVGNNGISGFIGPDGHGHAFVRGTRGQLWQVKGVQTARVRLDSRSPTFFTRYGAVVRALLPVSCLALLVVALVGGRRRRS